jgi:hypothetical protein
MDGGRLTYAWMRLFVALVLGTIGSVGMWSMCRAAAGAGRLRHPAQRVRPYTWR